MSGVDRLSELRGSTDVEQEPADNDKGARSSIPKENIEIAEHMKQYEQIKRGLDLIKANVAKVEKLKAKDRTTANEKSRKEIMDQLDRIMSETTAEGARIKKALDDIQNENKAFQKAHKDSAKTQMRVNLYQTHIRRFHAVMNDYNAASHEFKQNLQDRTRRQLKIVDSKISDEEIERIVESGQANDVIKQALISENLQEVVRDIEERHLDILKLEQQVLEVYELFRDLATLVDLQQESLDVIENRISHARDYAEKAEVQLQEAEQYQTKARKRKCMILIVLLVILVVILAPILGTQLVKG